MSKHTFNPRAEKQALRRTMMPLRSAASAANPFASDQLRDLFLTKINLPPHSVVSGYSAIKDELDPRPLAAALALKGHTLCLPVVTEKKRPLAFRLWQLDVPLVTGLFELQEPPDNMPLVTPSVILVPMLAFDYTCHRLGYGGGFYDRTISLLRKNNGLLTIGLAFSAQEVPLVPVDRNDVRLDTVVTESSVFCLKR